MKQNYIEITFGILFIIMLIFVAIPINLTQKHTKHIELIFHNFIQRFNRSAYLKNQTEYHKRYHIFEQNLNLITHLNATKIYGQTVEFGINKFTDITDDEFYHKFLYLDLINHTATPQQYNNHNRKIKNLKEFVNLGYPLFLDWRQSQIITNIRNQGLCGSCYAQSVIATIESQVALILLKNQTNSNANAIIKQKYQLKTSELIEFSIQQMIDCANNWNYGCLGGDICNLLEWLKFENITILTNELYPKRQLDGSASQQSNAKQQICQTQFLYNQQNVQQKHFLIAQVMDYKCYNFIDNEYEMLAVIAEQGPVAASVNGLLWKNYLGGVIQYHCNGPTNHAIQIIGYDLTQTIPYYLVRNSWGTDFGLDGYAKIGIGNNVCNIATEVSTIQVQLHEH